MDLLLKYHQIKKKLLGRSMKFEDAHYALIQQAIEMEDRLDWLGHNSKIIMGFCKTDIVRFVITNFFVMGNSTLLGMRKDFPGIKKEFKEEELNNCFSKYISMHLSEMATDKKEAFDVLLAFNRRYHKEALLAFAYGTKCKSQYKSYKKFMKSNNTGFEDIEPLLDDNTFLIDI